MTTGQMMTRSSFFGLWFCSLCGTTAGPMAIGISATVGREVIGLDTGTAAFLFSVFAIFNDIGRAIFGALADKITPRYAAIITFILIGIASFMMLGAGQGSVMAQAIAFCAIWLTLGGWLAIGPASTASFFGLDGYAQKQGVVFSAFGLESIAGGIISGSAKNAFGSSTAAFVPTLIIAIIGIIMAFIFVKPPKRQDNGLSEKQV